MTDKAKVDEKDLRTREQIKALYFDGVEGPDTHLTETLKAIGLKGDQAKFGPQNILAIANARHWINTDVVKDYKQLAEHWKANKDKLDSKHVIQESQAIAVKTGDKVTKGDEIGTGKVINPLAIPAQRGYDLGELAALQTHDQLQALGDIIPNVVNAAYLKGFQNGMDKQGATAESVGNGSGVEDLERMATEALGELPSD